MARSFKEMRFETRPDMEVYRLAATEINTIVSTTKDIDFVNHSNTFGHPPRILNVNVGNISNRELKMIIYKSFAQVIKLFSQPDKFFIEITK